MYHKWMSLVRDEGTMRDEDTMLCPDKNFCKFNLQKFLPGL